MVVTLAKLNYLHKLFSGPGKDSLLIILERRVTVGNTLKVSELGEKAVSAEHCTSVPVQPLLPCPWVFHAIHFFVPF